MPDTEPLVPAELRAEVGVLPNNLVEWRRQNDGTTWIGKADDSLMSLWGIIKTDVRLSDEELRQAIEDAREAMALGLDWD